MKKVYLFLFLLSYGALFSKTFAVSFNCSKASLPTEIAICSDAELSKLDDLMSNVYLQVHAMNPAIKSDQHNWVKKTRLCSNSGNIVNCLRDEYTNRLNILTQLIEINTVNSNNVTDVKRKQEIIIDKAMSTLDTVTKEKVDIALPQDASSHENNSQSSIKLVIFSTLFIGFFVYFLLRPKNKKNKNKISNRDDATELKNNVIDNKDYDTLSSKNIDPVYQKLSDNLGSDYKIHSIYNDNEMGVYLIFNLKLPMTDCMVHLHNMLKDVGTTYTFGTNNELKGKFNLDHLEHSELLDAVGISLYSDIIKMIGITPQNPTYPNDNARTMRLVSKIKEWLNSLNWNNEIYIDKETQTTFVSFPYQINDQSYDVIIESEEASDTIKIYIYAPFRVISTKITETTLALNHINTSILKGAFYVLPDHKVCWRDTVNFTETDPSIKTINNLLEYGVEVYQNWSKEISEVALSSETGQELLKILNGSSKSNEETVPDEF